ncbi:hypothetical protein KJ780_04370, partial [Candidatus Micrarchaeota archaeon]|nr:hypothetical protein [Candidatus Micrarchaeota archaeon]
VSFSLLSFIHNIIKKPFPKNTAEYQSLPENEKDSYSIKMGITLFVLFFSLAAVLLTISDLASPWIIPTWFILSIILLDLCILFMPSISPISDEGNFFARLLKSLKEYTELEKHTNINQFLAFGEYGAWALAIKMQNPEMNEIIEQSLSKAKIL